MHQSIAVIKRAIGYAAFTDLEIRARLVEHINMIGEDLGDIYETPGKVDDSTEALNQAMLDHDEKFDEAAASYADEDDDEE